MLLRVILPIAIAIVVMFGFWTWYRRKIAGLAPDTGERAIATARLTAERLRQMPSPPWRVVFEIGASHLDDIDHVIVGPIGVIAVETVMADRPAPEGLREQVEIAGPQLSANASIARGKLDELLEGTGLSCTTLARVHWGVPDDSQPAAVEMTPGLLAVEGHRLERWLMMHPPGTMTSAQVDDAWRRIVTGIGRPDPLG